MNKFLIKDVISREILDSRGTPTVETQVVLNCGACGVFSVPSGASTGEYEALELRDNDKKRYFGKGVLKAVDNVNNAIKKAIVGFDARKQAKLDQILIDLDGTPNKSKLGANAILSVSVANAKAVALAKKEPLYKYINKLAKANECKLPLPMFNIINGGMHADNNLDVQEFMITPIKAKSFSEGLQWCDEVFHQLKAILKENNMVTSVGDEGGFAPNLNSTEEALETILLAIKRAGYNSDQIKICLDLATSGWLKDEIYVLPKAKVQYTKSQFIKYLCELSTKYPIISFEDPLAENDWASFKKLTKQIGNKIQIVGDDLFVTNIDRLKIGIRQKSANAILIKLNQIGTLTETLNTIKLAKAKNFKTIISHRSGETEDTTIADLAVAVSSNFIKTGSLSRGERIAKYNRLLKIESELVEL